MASKKLTFTPEQKEQINQALERFILITNEAARAVFMEDLETTGRFRIFGGASLLTYSPLQNPDGSFIDNLEESFPGLKQDDVINITPAKLESYQKDFVCFDIHYRGTPGKPGITIGMEKKDGAYTPGGVLSTDISHLNSNIAANFIEYYLDKFAEREMPPNMPIYNFSFEETTLEDGQKVKALVCTADQNGPLYIHNPDNQFAQMDPFYKIARDEQGDRKKAVIMATAYNDKKPDGTIKTLGAITDLDYLRNMINDSLARNIEVESRFHKLYADAVIHRTRIAPEERQKLESLERNDSNCNAPDLLGSFMVAIGEHNERVRATHPAPAPQ